MCLINTQSMTALCTPLFSGGGRSGASFFCEVTLTVRGPDDVSVRCSPALCLLDSLIQDHWYHELTYRQVDVRRASGSLQAAQTGVVLKVTKDQ